MSLSTKTRTLIVGAGLSGLMAATKLLSAGYDEIIILDKGRSVGGRLATRRIGPGRADHGAQFFTVRSSTFRPWVDRWQEADLVYTWSHGWGHGSHAPSEKGSKGYPRYAVHGGMNMLAKQLATDLAELGTKIITGERINAISTDSKCWHLRADSGNQYEADQLVVTSPVPQTLALLDAGKTALSREVEDHLKVITYAPCLCLLIWAETQVDLPEPGALQTSDDDTIVSWIADNQRKGISPDAKIITVHGSPEFSQQHYDASDQAVLDLLWANVKDRFASPSRIREMQVKRWRYALPTTTYPEPYLMTNEPVPIYFGGDAFGGPRVEGAALSGLAIAEAIISQS